jgi:DNA-binding MarR family transcriptional regulator
VSNRQNISEITDPLEQWLGYRLRRASAAAMASLAPELSDENFSASLASVLLMIESNPGETQAQIGRTLAIKRANIAPMIARLENEKLIRKKSIDGRSFGLVATQRGKTQAERLAKIFSAHDNQMFGSLNQTERRQLERLLGQVWRAMSEKSG